MRKSTFAALAATGLVLAAPHAASAQTAPTIVTPVANGCVPTSEVAAGQDIGIQVAGFSPDSGVTTVITRADGTQFAGGGSAQTDVAGNAIIPSSFSNASESTMRAFSPGTLTASVTSLGLDQVQTPPVSIPVTVVNATAATTGGTRTGSPRRSVTWSFAAFAQPGQPIYGHVRFKGKTLRNFRFGTAGVCGTLTKKAPALPTRSGTIRSGTYNIQLDTSATYTRAADAPLFKYQVFQTFRSR